MINKCIIFMFFISLYDCRLPDKVSCVNEQCKDPISKGKTLLSYSSSDPDLISFRGNADAIIYMKSAGSNPDLWYASIDGQYGFVNTKFLREHKILKKKESLVVVPFQLNNMQNQVQPHKVQQAHEVFEGTTIFTTQTDKPQETVTETPTSVGDSVTEVNNSSEKSEHYDNSNQNVDQAPQDTYSDVNAPSERQEKSPIHQPVISTVSGEKTSSLNFVDVSTAQSHSDGGEINQINSPAALISPGEPFESSEIPSKNAVFNNIPQTESLTKGNIETINGVNVISEKTEPSQEFHEFNIPPIDMSKETVNPQMTSTTVGNIQSEQNPELTQQNTATTTKNLDPIIGTIEPIQQLPEPVQQVSESMQVIPKIVPPNSENKQQILEITSQMPETTSQTLETSTQIPETITKIPEITSQIPDTISQIPETATQIPDTISQIPETSSQIPESFSQMPQTNQQYVNPSLEIPVNLHQIPDTNHQIPDFKQQIPLTNQKIAEVTPEPIEQNSEPIQEVPNPVKETSEQQTSDQFYMTKTTTVTKVATNNDLPSNDYLSLQSVQPNDASSSSSTKQDNKLDITESTVSSNHYDSAHTTAVPPVIIESKETDGNKINPNTATESLESESSKTLPKTSSVSPDYSQPIEDIINDITGPSVEIKHTETPEINEDSNSIFSDIYSTILHLWSGNTEQSNVESLFKENTNQNNPFSDKQNIDETFSFAKFIMNPFFGPSEESKAIFASGGASCYSGDYCDGTSYNKNYRFLMFIVTTACSVLLFTLGYYYIDKRRQDGKHIAAINSLQRDLLFSTKECEILKEELTTTKTKLARIEDSSFGMDDMVQSLKEEIEEIKAQNERLRNSLDDNEKLLRVSENTAGELQNTLSDVENTLSELLAERASSEEHIAELNGKMQAFEEELISVSRDRDSFQLKFVSAESGLEEARKQILRLEESTKLLSDANNTIELQKHEITALKDAIREIKSGAPNDVDVTSLIDHTEIKAKLSKALQEKELYESKYEVEQRERKRLSEELQVTQNNLQTSSQQATEALTRLEVLGKYFQEREADLMKELNTKESLWLSKQGESTSTVEKMELLQQEIQRHKEKCDALELELAEQESVRRAAVGGVEARAHAAWLEARAAKREADAARDEAAALRRKLASLAADGAASPHHKVASPLESAEGALPPPLPPMFLPPPLLPPLPPLPRPPPLGRLPSPHPPRYSERRYSPDSRYSPESRYSPGSRYSPETVRYSPDSRYSPRVRRSPYSSRSRRRSKDSYDNGRGSRSRNVPADTETEYNSDSPTRESRRRRRYSRNSGPSSGSGCSSESDK